MNKNIKLALLIMATGLVLAGCAGLEQKLDGLITTKWDKTAKSTAVLYFDENFAIYKVDGKENVNIYGQATEIKGSGTLKAPKAHLIIPAGERKLVIGYKQNSILGDSVFNDKRYEVPYTFVAGRYYQLAATRNEDVKNPKITASAADLNRINQEEADKGAQGSAAKVRAAAAEHTKLVLAEEEFATNVEIIDITGGKKKNSPSSIVVVKPWENK